MEKLETLAGSVILNCVRTMLLASSQGAAVFVLSTLHKLDGLFVLLSGCQNFCLLKKFFIRGVLRLFDD
jgi:hypothetical protein